MPGDHSRPQGNIIEPLTLLALATLAASLVLAAQLARGLRSLPKLRAVPPIDPAAAPRVSIIVAARDEARRIAAAANTLLSQDYPRYEVVAVDDRSTDGTGAILDRLAEGRAVRSTDATAASEGSGGGGGGGGGGEGPALRVLHVTELPAGWLGKNHALHRGAELARGELLLFTDADVLMRPDALSRAVALLEREGVDHLAVAPRIHAGGAWTQAVVTVFLVVFSTFFRPWKARDPKSRWHIGIGAFNLVRASAYRAAGGHAAIRLRPDDDIRLGRRIKETGHRQTAAGGRDHLEVEWYPSLGAMARGLRKNTFAVAGYRLSVVAVGTLLPAVFIFWPVAALFLTTGATWWLNAAVVAVGLGVTTDTARGHGLPLWTGLAYPVGALLFLAIVWLAAIRAVTRGSVEWRGTEYGLEELRRG